MSFIDKNIKKLLKKNLSKSINLNKESKIKSLYKFNQLNFNIIAKKKIFYVKNLIKK